MTQFLERKLYSDVEGTCSGQYGYIIAVIDILEHGKGLVLSGSGQAEFVCRFRAIVFKPFKGEVMDGVVNNVMKVRAILFISGNWIAHCPIARLLRRRGPRTSIRLGPGPSDSMVSVLMLLLCGLARPSVPRV
jgi:hypothetical protein